MDEHEDARVALLSRLIDRAPVFPPSPPPLPDAIAEDARFDALSAHGLRAKVRCGGTLVAAVVFGNEETALAPVRELEAPGALPR